MVKKDLFDKVVEKVLPDSVMNAIEKGVDIPAKFITKFEKEHPDRKRK